MESIYKSRKTKKTKKSKRYNKKQMGGSNELFIIIDAILNMNEIYFLPRHEVFTNDESRNRYLSSIDVKTLLFLIEQTQTTNSKVIKQMFNNNVNNISDTFINDNKETQLVNNLLFNYNLIKPNIQDIQDVHYYKEFLAIKTSMDEINQKIQLIKSKIDNENIKLRNFKCVKQLDGNYNKLSEYILNCSNISNQNVNWINVILNIDKFDENYELEIKNYNNKNDIRINYNNIKQYINIIKDNVE